MRTQDVMDGRQENRRQENENNPDRGPVDRRHGDRRHGDRGHGDRGRRGWRGAILGGVCGLAGVAMVAPVAAVDLAERTVFLVCEGEFHTRDTSPLAAQMASNRYEPPAAIHDHYVGALYVTFTYTDDGFRTVTFQPFERDDRLLTQKFTPTPPARLTAAHASGDAATDHQVHITASEDEVQLREYRASGVPVLARVGDDPLAATRMRVQTVDMMMNRFSGKMTIIWADRNVLEVKPRGAIRATKVSFLDQKQFDATCRTMKERLF